jgi:hypothetical protein
MAQVGQVEQQCMQEYVIRTSTQNGISCKPYACIHWPCWAFMHIRLSARFATAEHGYQCDRDQ